MNLIDFCFEIIERNEALIKLVYPTMNTERFMRSDKEDEMKDNESNSIKQNDAEGNVINNFNKK